MDIRNRKIAASSRLWRAVPVLLLLLAVLVLVSAKRRHHEPKWVLSPSNSFRQNNKQFYRFKSECGKYGEPKRHHGSKRHRIAGGSDAPGDLYPSFVSIQINSASCSGVLVDEDIVLTAGHCLFPPGGVVNRLRVSNSMIPVWRWDNVPGTPIHDVQLACRATKHDNVSAIFDYGFLKLKRPLSLSSKVFPACLPDNPWTFEVATVLGQGYSKRLPPEPDFPDKVFHERPLKVKRLQVKKVDCPRDHWHSTKVCSQAMHPDSGDTCEGDSGGPVYLPGQGKVTVVAMTSTGESLCDPKVSSVQINADLGYYKNKYYILRQLKRCVTRGAGRVWGSVRPGDDDGEEDSGDEYRRYRDEDD